MAEDEDLRGGLSRHCLMMVPRHRNSNVRLVNSIRERERRRLGIRPAHEERSSLAAKLPV
jgi:hypothetical protein